MSPTQTTCHNKKPMASFFSNFKNYFIGIILQTAFGLGSIIIGTKYLNSDDYGYYSIILSLTTLLGSWSDAGSTTIITGFYKGENKDKSAISSLVMISILISLTFSLIFYVFQPTILNIFSIRRDISGAARTIPCLAIPAIGLNSILLQLLIVSGKGKYGGILHSLQGFFSFLSIIIFISIYNLGLNALFIAQISGVIIPTAIVAILIRNEFSEPPRFYWVKEILKRFPSIVAGSLSENFFRITEEGMLAKYSGLGVLGSYSHSKLYQGYINKIINATSYSILPRSLQEGREQGKKFQKTMEVWNYIYFFLSLSGIISITILPEIINIITHGKFIQASVFVPWLIVYIIIQHSAKGATAAIFAQGHGEISARIRTITAATGSVAIIILSSFYGVYGVLFSLIFEMTIFRLFCGIYAKAKYSVGFLDAKTIYSVIFVAMLATLNSILDLSNNISFSCRILIAILLSLAIAVINKNMIKRGIYLFKLARNVQQ